MPSYKKNTDMRETKYATRKTKLQPEARTIHQQWKYPPKRNINDTASRNKTTTTIIETIITRHLTKQLLLEKITSCRSVIRETNLIIISIVVFYSTVTIESCIRWVKVSHLSVAFDTTETGRYSFELFYNFILHEGVEGPVVYDCISVTVELVYWER